MVSAPVKVTGFKQPAGAYFDAATSAWYVSNVDGDPTQVASLKDNKAAISTYKIPKGHEDDDYGLGVFDITIPLLVHFDVFSAFNDYGVERWEDELLRRHLDPEPRRRSSDPA